MPQGQKLGPQVKNGGRTAAILVIQQPKKNQEKCPRRIIKFGADDLLLFSPV
jgi:hypothetical protein